MDRVCSRDIIQVQTSTVAVDTKKMLCTTGKKNPRHTNTLANGLRSPSCDNKDSDERSNQREEKIAQTLNASQRAFLCLWLSQWNAVHNSLRWKNVCTVPCGRLVAFLPHDASIWWRTFNGTHTECVFWKSRVPCATINISSNCMCIVFLSTFLCGNSERTMCSAAMYYRVWINAIRFSQKVRE